MRLGLIAGTILYDTDMFNNADKREILTPFGPALVLVIPDLAYLPRHGVDPDNYILPHKINHPANMWALKSLGAKEVVSLNSTGSLKPELKPGLIVVPGRLHLPGLGPHHGRGQGPSTSPPALPSL